MAEVNQKVENVKPVEEKEITLNMRKWILKAPLQKRAKKLAYALREVIKRITKVNEVKISGRLNKYIWSRGIKSPPKKLNLRIIKKEEKVFVDIKE
ncbi:MAG: hypothetical protein QW038_00880 [Nanopusillaceae archaeon]